ncbi:MAG: heavy-metal-associated domain-containing protein [Bacteroidetes bacterium]|nr:heavy-metal-associated domain-containing protein [Bacteroidota bacterium]
MNLLFKIIIPVFISCASFAQTSVKTVTFHVTGVCGECKERIENAADIKGVKKCTWDKKTKIVSVILDEKKVTQDQVEKAIAKAGYDTEHEKASEASYKKLPDCCHYKDPANQHQ